MDIYRTYEGAHQLDDIIKQEKSIFENKLRTIQQQLPLYEEIFRQLGATPQRMELRLEERPHGRFSDVELEFKMIYQAEMHIQMRYWHRDDLLLPTKELEELNIDRKKTRTKITGEAQYILEQIQNS